MPPELITQEQFNAFADDVARELGTHCRTAPDTKNTHMLARLIIDDDGRALNLRQHDFYQPTRLTVRAELPDAADLLTPSIGVTASSARHIAREITRRLYPLHARTSQQAAQLTAKRGEEARSRRAVVEAVAHALPGARIEENPRTTRVVWQRPCPGDRHDRFVQHDSVCVYVGPSGKRVSVEVAARPQGVVSMPAAFAEQCEP